MYEAPPGQQDREQDGLHGRTVRVLSVNHWLMYPNSKGKKKFLASTSVKYQIYRREHNTMSRSGHVNHTATRDAGQGFYVWCPVGNS